MKPHDYKNHQFGKEKIAEELAKRGLTIRRKGGYVNRVWVLSNGETYRSLAEIAAKYNIK